MCVTCGSGSAAPLVFRRVRNAEIPACDFTKEQLEIWQAKLLCVVSNNLFEQAGITKGEMNGYLGTILSVTKYNNNPCSYSFTLNKVLDLILRLTDLNLCI